MNSKTTFSWLACLIVWSLSITHVTAQTNQQTIEKKLVSKNKINKKKKSEVETLPSWAVPRFSIGLNPIAGGSLSVEERNNNRVDVLQIELGLAGSLNNVPVAAGNPGLFATPSLGYSMGTWNKISQAQLKSEVNSQYERRWGGLNFVYLWRFIKQTLGIKQGDLQFNKAVFGDMEASNSQSHLNSQSYHSDTAVLILPWLSGHLTMDFINTTLDNYSDALITEKDYWLHVRMFFNVMDAYVDVGPGKTEATEAYKADSLSMTQAGSSNYFLILSGLDLPGPLEMNAKAKYLISTTNDNMGYWVNLPTPLYSAGEASTSGGMPDDSFIFSFFLGARNLIGGIGFGFVYDKTILNLSNSSKRIEVEEKGLKATYSFAF